VKMSKMEDESLYTNYFMQFSRFLINTRDRLRDEYSSICMPSDHCFCALGRPSAALATARALWIKMRLVSGFLINMHSMLEGSSLCIEYIWVSRSSLGVIEYIWVSRSSLGVIEYIWK
jgi:hypothetical protein